MLQLGEIKDTRNIITIRAADLDPDPHVLGSLDPDPDAMTKKSQSFENAKRKKGKNEERFKILV